MAILPKAIYRFNAIPKKAEHQRIDALELWCWRRLLRKWWHFSGFKLESKGMDNLRRTSGLRIPVSLSETVALSRMWTLQWWPGIAAVKFSNSIWQTSIMREGRIKTIWKSESCSLISDSLGVYTICRILQARILEWVAFPFSSRSSQSRNWTRVSCIAGGFFTSWAIRETI